MAKKKTVDAAAAKAKKQKTMLIVGLVLLVVMGAIQGPKLLKKSGAPEAAPAPTATDTGAVATDTGTAARDAAAGTTPPATIPGSTRSAGSVSGVALPAPPKPTVGSGQLASFTLFDPKDPFVQQIDATGADGSTTNATTTATEPPAATKPSVSSPAGPGTGVQGGSVPPEPMLYATINLDGKPQQMKVKDAFPEGNPKFVLVSLKKKQATIGVAGGSFERGKTVTAVLGKRLTLVNTATGVRFELELVYTGSSPEAIEGFTAGDTGTTSGSTTASTSETTATP